MSVLVHEKSYNSKLAPVRYEPKSGRSLFPRPVATGPFCSSTFAAIQASCPDSCRFKRDTDGTSHGCFADAGLTRGRGKKLDTAAAGMSALEVAKAEALAIRRMFRGRRIPQDGARGGRDLRIHVGGDATTDACARELAGAADDWRARGGGAVWSYSHSWRDVKRSSWGSVSVLASIEDPADARRARARGYVAALVVERFPSERRFTLAGEDFIPCPAETRGRTCVECRLCFDDDRLRRLGVGIAFALHGSARVIAKESLLQIRMPMRRVA